MGFIYPQSDEEALAVSGLLLLRKDREPSPGGAKHGYDPLNLLLGSASRQANTAERRTAIFSQSSKIRLSC
jgi:hypothetical protein